MDTKALRQKVLDLAIRGKLVPQDPNDEPADLLLERIRQQKQQMVKEGKLKAKDIKNDTVIFVGEDNLHYEKFADGSVKCIEDEIPFDLPDSWAWSRFGCIVTLMSGTTYPAEKELISGERLYVKVGDMNLPGNEHEIVTSSRYLDEYSTSHLVPVNSVIFPKRGGAIATNKKKLVLQQEILIDLNTMAFTPILPVNLMYCYYWFLSIDLGKINSGSSVPQINNKDIEPLLFPVPPVSEQEKIVQAVVPLLAAEQKISVAGSEIARLISCAKSKILDLAIRGQLVPQDPADEPASVLLERIRAEKEELIKQGKIKRDKKESVIFKGEDNSYYLNDGQMTVDINDDLPFDIPDSWCWARLKDVFIINPRNKLDDELDVSFIPMPLIDDGYSGKHTAEVRQWKEVKTGFTHFAEGDIGVAKITPCFENRKSTVFENLSNGYGAGTTELHILRPFGPNILAQYLLAYVKSDYFVENGKQTFTGAVGQQRISKEYVENAYFPIPPIKEQERIVQQISAVFEYLNMISYALS